jgi:hypothetical protein
MVGSGRHGPGLLRLSRRRARRRPWVASERNRPREGTTAEHITVLTTTDTADRASDLARAVVEARTAACAEIVVTLDHISNQS